MISVCFLFFKIPLPRGGSYPSIAIPTGAKHRVQSPLERWPHTISTDRPEMESRPYEFLLHHSLVMCYSEHILRLSLVEDDLSAILDPFGSNQFMLCPRFMLFFQRLCPGPFPPVSLLVDYSYTYGSVRS